MTDRTFFENEFPAALGTHGRIVACSTIRAGGGGEWQSVFYAAVQNNDDAPHMPGRTWALVVLMHRGRGQFNFTYKEMSDESGPGEDDAPAKVLDLLSPTDREYANEWRSRCRANLVRRTARVTARPGDQVEFATPIRFSDGTEHHTLTFVTRSTFTGPNGKRYRVTSWRDRPHTVVKVIEPTAEQNEVAAALRDRVERRRRAAQ